MEIHVYRDICVSEICSPEHKLFLFANILHIHKKTLYCLKLVTACFAGRSYVPAKRIARLITCRVVSPAWMHTSTPVDSSLEITFTNRLQKELHVRLTIAKPNPPK